MEVKASNKSLMRTKDPQDPLTPRLRIDLSGTTGKNPLDKLVRPAYTEFAKSVTETSSKMREPMTYNKVISNPIYENR